MREHTGRARPKHPDRTARAAAEGATCSNRGQAATWRDYALPGAIPAVHGGEEVNCARFGRGAPGQGSAMRRVRPGILLAVLLAVGACGGRGRAPAPPPAPPSAI